MNAVVKLVAAHPIRKKPYNAIKFSRFDDHGTPLYRVARGTKDMGAASALGEAFRQFGGHCFYCKAYMPPQAMSQQCTRDHLRSRKEGGANMLHNLVFACGKCNRDKGAENLIVYRQDDAIGYLRALDDHIVRCLKAASQTANAGSRYE